MRSGWVYYKEWLAGEISETNEGEFIFRYDENYVREHPNAPISLTMPVTENPYHEKRLFPFFEGLIPEGWLLDVATKNWKIKANDRMGLLLACCQNCIGAVSVIPKQNEDGK